MIPTEEFLMNSKTEDEQLKLRVNLIYSGYWMQEKMTAFLSQFGITPQQFNVLEILSEQKPEPISTKEIRERMIVSNADTSRLVDRLCEKGLIWKRPCPHDGRLIQVFIDKNGETLLKQINKQKAVFDLNFDNLNEKETKALNQLLNKLRYKK